jgi:hypothetical protein
MAKRRHKTGNFSAALCLIALLAESVAFPHFALAAEDAPANSSPPLLCATPFIRMYKEQQIARAKYVIRKYIHDKYAWDDSLYHIGKDAKNAGFDVARFLIKHQNDEHPAAPGGGKSLVIEVDMRTMRIVRELGFQ